MFEQDPMTWMWPTDLSLELRQNGTTLIAWQRMNLSRGEDGLWHDRQAGATLSVTGAADLMQSAGSARATGCDTLDWDNRARFCRKGGGTEVVHCRSAAARPQAPARSRAAARIPAASLLDGLPRLSPAEGFAAALCLFGLTAQLAASAATLIERALGGLSRGIETEAGPHARDCFLVHPDHEAPGKGQPIVGALRELQPQLVAHKQPASARTDCPAQPFFGLAAAALAAALQASVQYQWFTLVPTGLQLSEYMPALRTLPRTRLFLSFGASEGHGGVHPAGAPDIVFIAPRSLAEPLREVLEALARSSCLAGKAESLLLSDLRTHNIPYQVYPYGRRPQPFLPPAEGHWRGAAPSSGGATAAPVASVKQWAAAFCIVGAVRTFLHALDNLVHNGINAMAVGAAPGAPHARDVYAILNGETRHQMAPAPNATALHLALRPLRPVRVRVVPNPGCTNPEVKMQVACCSQLDAKGVAPATPESKAAAAAQLAAGQIQNLWISECFGMVAEEEKAKGFRYDWVVRLRPDLFFLEPAPSLHNLSPDRLYVSMKNRDPSETLWDVVYAVPGQMAGQFRRLLREAWHPLRYPGGHCYLAGVRSKTGKCDCAGHSQLEPEAHLHHVWTNNHIPFQVYPFVATLLRGAQIRAGAPEHRRFWLDCWRFHRGKELALPHALQVAGSRWGRHIAQGGNVTVMHHGDWCTLQSCRIDAGWKLWKDDG